MKFPAREVKTELGWISFSLHTEFEVKELLSLHKFKVLIATDRSDRHKYMYIYINKYDSLT